MLSHLLVIANRDSGVAIRRRRPERMRGISCGCGYGHCWLLPEIQEITNYILVICPDRAALRALIFLREKFMLRFARNDG